MTQDDGVDPTTDSADPTSHAFEQRFVWLAESSIVWLMPGILIGLVIVISYLWTHPYPAFGAGLYLLMANRIAENAYLLPQTIPHYTNGGLPFAYPPFGMYLAAVLRDVFGVRLFTLARVLPGIITVGYLIPAYALAEELLNSRPRAGLATVILAVSPPVLQWHLSAGGFVRATAFTWVIIGLYAGLRLFRDQNNRWLPVAMCAFTATGLSHPQYTVFFVASFILLWLLFDRSVRGFCYGLTVGFGGLLLSAPWWGQVIQAHGIDVFMAAAGAQGGIGSTLSNLAAVFEVSSWSKVLFFFWGPFSLFGSFYLLAKRRIFLPAWLLLAALILDKARFPFFVGVFLSASVIIEGAETVIRPFIRTKYGLRVGVSSFVLIFIVLGLVISGLYVTSSIDTHAGSQSLPAFIDEDDMAAMQWVQQNTAPSAQFVVLGDAAEWFPQQAHRTILIGPWGVEWMGQEAYRTQIRQFKQISTCDTSRCVTKTLHQAEFSPEYLYVPKGTYTVRGMKHRQGSQTVVSFRSAEHYRQVFENDGVVIFATTSDLHSKHEPAT